MFMVLSDHDILGISGTNSTFFQWDELLTFFSTKKRRIFDDQKVRKCPKKFEKFILLEKKSKL